jgi:prepilin-type processing-associated H-X9-DG protein
MPALVIASASAMLPAMLHAKSRAKQVASANNLRQLGQACMAYAADNKDRLPASLSQLGAEGLIDTSWLISPISGKRPPRFDKKTKQLTGPVDYILVNYSPKTTTNIASPARAILAYERPGNYQNRGTEVLFVDGHVEWVPMGQLGGLLNKSRPANKSNPAGK